MVGFFSKISLIASTCPLLFLTFFSFLRKIPELGLGANLVRGLKLHAVNLRMLIGFSGQSTPNNLVLVELESNHFR